MRRTDAGVAIVRAHAAAAVDEQQHRLVALILEFADDRLADALRGFPVDAPDRIAIAIFGQLLEVRAFAALLEGLDADFLQATVASEPRVTRDLREIRIHATPLRLTE